MIIVKEEIKIGDIVQGYPKGYWRVIDVQKRSVTQEMINTNPYLKGRLGEELPPTLQLELICKEGGFIPKSKKIVSAQSSWMRKVSFEDLKRRKNETIELWDKIIEVVFPDIFKNEIKEKEDLENSIGTKLLRPISENEMG